MFSIVFGSEQRHKLDGDATPVISTSYSISYLMLLVRL